MSSDAKHPQAVNAYIDQLREALIDEWKSNHERHCRGEFVEWDGPLPICGRGERCEWDMPEILLEKPAAGDGLLEACKAMAANYEAVARNSYTRCATSEFLLEDVEAADPDGYRAWMLARTAIAKAEGRQA